MRKASSKAKEDRRLVKRIVGGDEAAFEQFANDYIPALYRFALRRLRGDRDLTNDVIQSTLCKVIPKLETYRGDAALVTWLCACCRNEIAAHLRQRGKTVQESELTYDVASDRSLNPVLMSDPERSFITSESAGVVHDALDRLPPRYGRALEWKYLEELSVKEIANRLGVTPKATESLLTRARKSLRKELRNLGGTQSTTTRRS